jgi:tripartite-type tricarboxylate transporter receptor subunit TctC
LRALLQEIPADRLAVHFHDTRGLGAANAWAAIEAGVRRLDASVGGIGGCPFAPGAAGNLASTEVARAPGDGLTLLLGSAGPNAISPAVYPNFPFDPVKDIAPVSMVAQVPSVLAVRANLEVKSVADLVKLARAQPGRLTFASSGSGSTLHLAGELFKQQARVFILHIPYRGTVPAAQDVAAGNVDMIFGALPSVMPLVRAGKLRALAVTTPRRAPQLPDVPTLEEVGLKGFEMTNWYGLMAPGTTPRALVNQINADGNRLMKEPAIRDKLVAVGTDIGGGTPEDFDAFLRSELARYARVVKSSGVVIDN